MITIALFGFYCPDDSLPSEDCRSPVNTRDFMRVVWEMEPPESRVGHDPDVLRVAKLTNVFIRPVYVQALSDEMASGAGLLKSDGYVAIIDAVKILAPNAIRAALRRLSVLHPGADVIIAAGRQNEPDALSSDEIREVLGLHPQQLIMPYTPDQPTTVHRIIRRLVRYIDNAERVPPPIFAGDVPTPPAIAAELSAGSEASSDRPTQAAPASPRVHGLVRVRIGVRDLDRALAFYHDLLGFPVLGYIDDPALQGARIAHLDTGRGVLELVTQPDASTSPASTSERAIGLQQLSLRVVALDALVESLVEAGAQVLLKPVTTHSQRRALLADPDGTRIELLEGETVYTRR